jgi:hypothetical protein
MEAAWQRNIHLAYGRVSKALLGIFFYEYHKHWRQQPAPSSSTKSWKPCKLSDDHAFILYYYTKISICQLSFQLCLEIHNKRKWSNTSNTKKEKAIATRKVKLACLTVIV